MQDTNFENFDSTIIDRKRKAAFYTRPEIAHKMAEIVHERVGENSSPISIIDPACGTGNLLVAAKNKFPQAHLIGVDIEFDAIIRAQQRLHRDEIFVMQRGIGSLEWLDEFQPDFFSDQNLQHKQRPKVDVVIMNPPYSRTHTNSTIFNDPSKDAKLSKLAVNTPANAFAGLASHFIVLADKLLKQNGILATILPYTMLFGQSWCEIREMISQKFKNIEIHILPSTKALSNDTHIQEIILIAEKDTGDGTGIFKFGNSSISVSGKLGSFPWTTASFRNPETNYLLSEILELVPMKQLASITDLSPEHKSTVHAKPPIFESSGYYEDTSDCEFSGLHYVRSKDQNTLVIVPNVNLTPLNPVARDLYSKSIAKFHIVSRLRINTQSIICGNTDVKTLGISTWNTLLKIQNSIISLWLNSSVGLAIFYKFANKSQHPRITISRTILQYLPILDMQNSKIKQLHQTADLVFNNMKNHKFLPYSEMNIDVNRHKLDNELCDLLGINVNMVIELRELLIDEINQHLIYQ